jgi:hypothetical protein
MESFDSFERGQKTKPTALYCATFVSSVTATVGASGTCYGDEYRDRQYYTGSELMIEEAWPIEAY